MKTTLIALAALAAGLLPSITEDVAAGAEFEADAVDAAQLVAEGKAKAAAPQAPEKKGKTVKARVLFAGAHGKVNDLVELPESVAKQAEKDGLVDTDKAAVAYAATLDQNKPKA